MEKLRPILAAIGRFLARAWAWAKPGLRTFGVAFWSALRTIASQYAAYWKKSRPRGKLVLGILTLLVVCCPLSAVTVMLNKPSATPTPTTAVVSRAATLDIVSAQPSATGTPTAVPSKTPAPPTATAAPAPTDTAPPPSATPRPSNTPAPSATTAPTTPVPVVPTETPKPTAPSLGEYTDLVADYKQKGFDVTLEESEFDQDGRRWTYFDSSDGAISVDFVDHRQKKLIGSTLSVHWQNEAQTVPLFREQAESMLAVVFPAWEGATTWLNQAISEVVRTKESSATDIGEFSVSVVFYETVPCIDLDVTSHYWGEIAKTETARPQPTTTPQPADKPTAIPPTAVPAAPAAAKIVIAATQRAGTPESITIKNTGSAPQDMTGWQIVSVTGDQRFTFPGGYILAPGASVTVYSGKGCPNEPPAKLCWEDKNVWNNDGDPAQLLDNTGKVVDDA